MASIKFSKHIVTLIICIFFTIYTLAQDSSAAPNFKFVVLVAGRENNAAPDYPKLKPKLETAIKELLLNSKVPLPKNQKELTAKDVKPCDILTCTYTIPTPQA